LNWLSVGGENMKMNLTVDLNAEKIAELTDQLPQKEFSRVKKLIEEKARLRFRSTMISARKEFQHSKMTPKDAEHALAEARGKA
jgi:N-methylhydantoinase A/oxoprolinase/acetone carboxylase beta subunit